MNKRDQASKPIKIKEDHKKIDTRAKDESIFFELEYGAPLLDLHGLTQDEAWYEVEHFIDQQLAAGQPGVKIMHGIGTGTLKKMLQQKLQKHPKIQSIRSSHKTGEMDAVMVALFHSTSQKR